MKISKITFFIIGVALFALLLYKANIKEISANLKIIGYNIYIPFCISMTGYFFHALAWHKIFYQIEKTVKLFFLFKIKLIGETINSLIPLGMGAGDPFRALSLRTFFPMVKITASIIIERTIYFFVSIISIYIGIFILFIRIKVPSEIKSILIMVLVGISVLFLLLFIKQRKNFLSSLLHFIEKTKLFPIKKYWKEKAEEVDKTIYTYYKEHKKIFLITNVYTFLGRLGGTLEIYMIMVLLNLKGSFVDAFLIHAVTQIVNLAFSIVPATLGVMEGAYGLIFHLLGHDATDGITLQIVRRVRVFMMIFVGLLLSLTMKKKKHT